jgi:hypothetical protein
MSAYAFHVYSWTKALDTDLIVGGIFFFLFLHRVWNLRIDAGQNLHNMMCEYPYVRPRKNSEIPFLKFLLKF